MYKGIVISITPKRSASDASLPEGMDVFSVEAHDTDIGDKASCEVILPSALVKLEERSLEDGERLAAWLSLGLLSEENRPVREMVELAWNEVTFLNQKRPYADLIVVIYNNEAQDNGWDFDWNEEKTIDEWSHLAIAEQNARCLDRALPNPGPKRGMLGRF